jgi:methylase of polypeptide subunit release factors
MTDASEAVRPAIVPALRPSEYTAALIQALQADRDRVRGARVLEIGAGSGIVLAALGAMGAAALCGVDIEPDAVVASCRLLGELGLGATAELHRGDMWLPVAGRRFDLIVANLPHFPMEPASVAARLPTWSSGGADGRWLLDPFLEGLPVHLAPGGRAVLTHNAFVGIDRSRDIARSHGLSLRVLLTVMVYIAEEKIACMTPRVLRAEDGRSLHRYGPHTIAEMHIVEIGAATR